MPGKKIVLVLLSDPSDVNIGYIKTPWPSTDIQITTTAPMAASTSSSVYQTLQSSFTVTESHHWTQDQTPYLHEVTESLLISTTTIFPQTCLPTPVPPPSNASQTCDCPPETMMATLNNTPIQATQTSSPSQTNGKSSLCLSQPVPDKR